MKKILAGILACVFALGTLCACGGSGNGANGNGETQNFPSGSFYTLKEAYANGWLTREDLMEITYRGSGEVLLLTVPESEIPKWGITEEYFQEIDYTSPYPDPVLDKNTEKAIAYAEFGEIGSDGILFLTYCGEFNGCYVVRIVPRDSLGPGGGPYVSCAGVVWHDLFPYYEVFRFDQEK